MAIPRFLVDFLLIIIIWMRDNFANESRRTNQNGSSEKIREIGRSAGELVKPSLKYHCSFSACLLFRGTIVSLTRPLHTANVTAANRSQKIKRERFILTGCHPTMMARQRMGEIHRFPNAIFNIQCITNDRIRATLD